MTLPPSRETEVTGSTASTPISRDLIRIGSVHVLTLQIMYLEAHHSLQRYRVDLVSWIRYTILDLDKSHRLPGLIRGATVLYIFYSR